MYGVSILVNAIKLECNVLTQKERKTFYAVK